MELMTVSHALLNGSYFHFLKLVTALEMQVKWRFDPRITELIETARIANAYGQ